VFGALFVAAVLAGLVSGLLTAPFGSNLALRAIGQSIGQIITMPFTALVGVLLYLDVRVRKERYDPTQLEADLARSGPAPTTG
jgi:fructose-specific phosphotransferase system IIC component